MNQLASKKPIENNSPFELEKNKPEYSDLSKSTRYKNICDPIQVGDQEHFWSQMLSKKQFKWKPERIAS